MLQIGAIDQRRHIVRLACLTLATTGIVAAPAPGQTGPAELANKVPISGVPLAEGWRTIKVVEGLEHPWAMAFVPGSNDILITERPGRLRLVRDGKLVEQPLRGVPEVMAKGQGGLLDIAVHPQFAENRYVYLTYAAGTEEANRTSVARGRLSDDATELLDLKTLYEVKPDKPNGQHFGSRLAWMSDGTLLVSIGDGGNPPTVIGGMPARDQAQNRRTPHGSILRLNDDGSVPKDNPFVGQDDALPELFSYGHRNIQGLTVAPDGQVWATEHGPLGGDELNLVRKGENHGWPINAHGYDYRTAAPINPDRQLGDAVQPKLLWNPCIAPSGLTVYTGDQFPQWQGDLLGGGLLTKDVRRIRVEDGRVALEQTLPLASRVRSVTVGPDGMIYVLTDDEEGELICITPPTAPGAATTEPAPDQPYGRKSDPTD